MESVNVEDTPFRANTPPSSMTIDPVVQEAVSLLRAGDVVALPTETVYGLAANALDDAAVNKIFEIKSRPRHHPLIVHLPHLEAINGFAEITDTIMHQRVLRLMSSFAPGPLTVLLPRRVGVAEAASGGHPTIALRISAHPLFQAVVAHFQGLAAPSANPYGRISPTSAAHVRADLGAKIPLVVDGGVCREGVESTIVNVCDSNAPPMIMRPGPISLEALADCLGEAVQPMRPATPLPATPGNVWRHYAPNKPFRAVTAEALTATFSRAQLQGKKIGLMLPSKIASTLAKALRPEALVLTAESPTDYAHDLYQNLRQLDASAATELWVVLPEAIATPAWATVRDRLSKALAQETFTRQFPESSYTQRGRHATKTIAD